MTTITAKPDNILEISIDGQEPKTVRIIPGNNGNIATSDGTLLRVINDLSRAATFTAITTSDKAKLSKDGSTLTVDAPLAWMLISNHGEKIIL